MVSNPQRLTWNVLLAVALAVMLAAIGASPVMSHPAVDTAQNEEPILHDETPLDPLFQFEWVGPKGSDAEDAPCHPGNTYTGSNHIGHHYQVEGLNPDDGNYIIIGSTDFWGYDETSMAAGWHNPRAHEGASPTSSMTGMTGFWRGQFQQTILDGPGWDFWIKDFHGWSSYCIYGAHDKGGPYIMVGTAFFGVQGFSGGTPLDLEFIYTPLSNEYYGTSGPGWMDYVFVVASMDKYPGLLAKFITDPVSPTSVGQDVTFIDKSKRYGWGNRTQHYRLDYEAGDCSNPAAGQPIDMPILPEPGESIQRSVDIPTPVVGDCQMRDNSPDPIVDWQWYFDDDPSETGSTVVPCGTYCYTAATTWNGQFPPSRVYSTVGDYNNCLVVTTREGAQDDFCDTMIVNDLPPVADLSYTQTACYFPATTFTDISYEPPDGTIVTRQWDFGDGTASNQEVAKHAYKDSGVYTVTLTVWDDDGETDTKQVIIRAVGVNDCGIPPSRSLSESEAGASPSDGLDQSAAQNDGDGDGWPDSVDNCVDVASDDQTDTDGDGLGDPCDLDLDGDSILNVYDNCRYVPNDRQTDLDQDLVGDLCDGDVDGDNVDEVDAKGVIVDNCPRLANPDQADPDGDGIGSLCDSDRDGDGVSNMVDVYPDDPTRWSDGLLGAAAMNDAKGRGTSAVDVHGEKAKFVNPWIVLGLVGAASILVLVAVVVLRRK